jgi:serine/threonine protein kinase
MVRSHLIIFICRSDFITAGLQLLRKLGWLHRDVSIGSILSFEGKAKLADLEYAKKVGSTKSYSMQIVREFSLNYHASH